MMSNVEWCSAGSGCLWRIWRWINQIPLPDCSCCQSPHRCQSGIPSVSQNITYDESSSRSVSDPRRSPEAILGLSDENYANSLKLDLKNLHFDKDLGQGWFGFVLEGHFVSSSQLQEERAKICQEDSAADLQSDAEEQPDKRTVVQRLSADAKTQEWLVFLEDAKASAKSANHPNVLRLVGYYLHSPPMLLAFEYCQLGDLKTFLINHRDRVEWIEKQNLHLKFCREVTAGLTYLHQINVVPWDLAARTCQLDSQYTLKIGDYGLARQRYPEDYLSCDLVTTAAHTAVKEDLSFKQRLSHLPLRWLPPEVLTKLRQSGGINYLHHTQFSSLRHELSAPESVWVLGVVMWEVLSMAATPFGHIEDHQFFASSSRLMSDSRRPFGSGASLQDATRPAPGPIALSGNVTEALRSIIQMCLNFEVSSRTTCVLIEKYLHNVSRNMF